MSSSGERVVALVSKCKLSNDVDVKLDVVGQLQREFEAGSLELLETEELMNTLKSCLRSPNQHLCIATMSAAATLYPLLMQSKSRSASQDSLILRQFLSIFLPSSGIIEKLGDAKEKVREKAQQVLLTIGSSIIQAGGLSTLPLSKGKDTKVIESPFQLFERFIREQGLGSKNWRVKEQTILSLVQLRRMHVSFPLKPFLPGLVDSLESSDGTVRECAKQAVIDIFTGTNISDMAKSELKKEMIKKNVRKSILDVVLAKILNPEPDRNVLDSDNVEVDNGKGDFMNERPPLVANPSRTTILDSERPSTQTSLTSPDIVPVYIASAKDLESEYAKMQPAFEGKETEHNWLERERSIMRVRSMLKGDVHSRFPDAFISGLKNGFLEATLKSAVSLRTTLASATCSLYSELAICLGQGLDPFVEVLLTHLLRMAGYTKKIIASQSQAAVGTILRCTSPLVRQVLPLLAATLQEKTVQTRAFVVDHLKTFVDYHGANNRHLIDSTGGTELLDKSLRKGLADTNPGVREKTRLLFWSFEPIWGDRATVIMESLDVTARKQLQKADPSGTAIKPSTPVTKKSSIAASIAATRAKAQKIASAPSSLKQQALSTSRTQNESHTPPRFSPSSTMKGTKKLERNRSSLPSPSETVVQPSLSLQSRKRSSSISSSSSSPPPSPLKDLHRRRESSSLVNQTFNLAHSNHNIPSLLDGDISLEQSQFPVLTSLLSQEQMDDENPQLLAIALNIPLPLDEEMVGDKEALEIVEEPALSRMTTMSDNSIRSMPSPTPPSHLKHISNSIVEDALRARAAQAESAAERLLELVEPDEELHISPIPASLLLHNAVPTSPKPNSHRPPLPVTPVHQKSAVMRQAALFQDSPLPPVSSPSVLDVLEENKHQTGWWLKRINVLGQGKLQTLISSDNSNKRIEMINEYIAQLNQGSVDLQVLQRLMMLCQHHRSTGPGMPDPTSSAQAWDGAIRADQIFNCLNNVLQSDKDPEFLIYGLFILWELLPHLDGLDGDVLALLLRLRYAQDYNVDEGTVIIRDAQVELMNERNYTLYGLSTMRICLKNFLSHTEPKSVSKDVKLRAHAFGLITMAKFIIKLPADILEEELPKIKSNLIDAYLNSESVVRQAATAAITAAQVILRDETHLFALLGPLPDDKKNLLTYFFEKNNARGSVGKQAENDGMDKLFKEMVRLDQRISTPPRLRS